MKIAFAHNNDPANLGDQVCSPIDYFNWAPHQTQRCDLFADLKLFADSDALIVGGGGLLHPGLEDRVRSLMEFFHSQDKPAIGWGFGSNRHGTTHLEHPTWLDRLNLLGLRDPSHYFDWVPCVSCFAPLFDCWEPEVQPIIEVRHYYHQGRGLPLPGVASRMSNRHTADEFPYVTNFLAGAETVITDTFHGAYWSFLLGRKVLLLEPFASRFWSFPFPVTVCDRHNWGLMLEWAQPAPEGFLKRCRAANATFKARVDKRLGA
jgi:hypothetical protein